MGLTWAGLDLQISSVASSDLSFDMEDDHQELVEQILNPSPENAHKILADLHLDRLPTRDEVHRAIEEKLLVPKEAFPAHWLPHYQV